MASNQGRLFSSIIKLSTPKLGLSYVRSESVILPGSKSARRLICSSTQHQEVENPSKQAGEESEIKEKIQTEKDDDVGEEEEEGGEDYGVHMNKETGEIGGPSGPEPTRYGDWEKKGRCSDF